MKLTKRERSELQRQAGSRNGRADSARHARLILLLAEGRTWSDIRAKFDCSELHCPLEQAVGCGSAGRIVCALRGARGVPFAPRHRQSSIPIG